MGAGNDILAELRQVRAELAEIKALILRGAAPTTSAPAIAADSDLDSQWGDEEIRRDPPRWAKDPERQPVAPCRMSSAPADYLDVLADFYDWKAGKDEEAAPTLDGEERSKKIKYAGYARKSAARARGWAARRRREVDEL